MRRTLAKAIRTVLQDGRRKVKDPVSNLRSASAKLRKVVAPFEQASGRAS